MEKLKDEVDESINRVEGVLRQDIDQMWEYAVRNKQYSRKNNLRVLGLEEEEGENLEENFIKLVEEHLQEEVLANAIEIIHRIGAPKRDGRDRGSQRDTRPRPPHAVDSSFLPFYNGDVWYLEAGLGALRIKEHERTVVSITPDHVQISGNHPSSTILMQ
ncbi:hypothetical protein ACROYT_G014824 [Oculina patagonica]